MEVRSVPFPNRGAGTLTQTEFYYLYPFLLVLLLLALKAFSSKSQTIFKLPSLLFNWLFPDYFKFNSGL
jgi:hypothetical protein